MKIAKLRNTLLALATALTLVIGPASGYAAADTSSSALKNNANSLKLAPLRTDLTVNPGKSGTVTVYVTNLTGNTIVLQPIENDFVSGDEKGTPAIILDQNSYAPTHSLKRFMVPLQNITVGAHVTQAVNLTINVPATAQAGGYFGALRFAPAGAADQPVALSSSVASLILLTVPGPTVEKLALTNFDVQQNGGTASNFRTPDNLSLLVRFQNKGNLQEAPFGQIAVQQGKKVLYTYNFNQQDPKDEVLPDSSRRWLVPLKHLGKFGKYTVSGTFGYGKGQTIQVSKTVWIIPTAYIIAAVAIVLAIILIIFGTRFFLKSYKRRILRSSSRRRY